MDDYLTDSFSTPSILLVDDIPHNLRLLTEILKNSAYTIRAARNGQTALQSARSAPPDLILLDIMMPDLDGYQVCQELKADERTRDIPVIFISALHEVFDKVKAFNVGGVDYITKPFEEEEVLARVRTHLSLRQAQKILSTKNRQLQQELNERNRIERAVIKAKQEWEKTFDAVPDLIAILDHNYRIIRINKAMARRFHREPKDCIGQLCYRLIHHRDRPPASCPHARLLADGQQHSKELYEPTLGSYFLITDSPIFDDDGHLFGNVHVARDITERRQAEEALRNAQETAQAANRAKSKFLANMSHELRTPLNAILGFAQIMEHSPTLTLENQESLAIIQRSGDHLLTLINQVLDLSKIEAGKMTLDAQNFNLVCLMDEIEDLFSLKAQRKGLFLHVDCAADVPRYIRTDQVKLRQILLNLLSNAFKFTEIGGVSVRIAALTQDPPQIQFEIADTGPGIAEEYKDQLFEAFARISPGSQIIEGTGLGLPLSQQFVRFLGGELTVMSEPGDGTTFTFTLPIQVVEETAIAIPPTPRRVVALEPEQPNYRILIVDDTPDTRLLLLRMLGPFGFALREAANGQEAVEIWQHWQPHLIWMDLRMPVLGGYDATQQIRDLETRTAIQAQTLQDYQHRTKIIALSASSFGDERSVALRHNCDDFVRKPFREADIFEMLQKHLGVHFKYADAISDNDEGEPKKEIEGLTSETLASLPQAWIQDLRQAVAILDINSVNTMIEQIRPQNARLAAALTRAVKEYRFDRLQALFKA